MLGGLDPIIIFYRFKKVTDPSQITIAAIPVSSAKDTYVDLPPIPIYLSQQITGIQIDSETKDIAIETETQTLSDGTVAQTNQKGLTSNVSVTLSAEKDSIGIAILSAFIDDLFDKVTSKEYAITYIHGPTTIFRGLLQTFSVDQTSGSTLMQIKFQLSKGQKQPIKNAVVAPVPVFQGTASELITRTA